MHVPRTFIVCIVKRRNELLSYTVKIEANPGNILKSLLPPFVSKVG
jgi:hypothetical protein